MTLVPGNHDAYVGLDLAALRRHVAATTCAATTRRHAAPDGFRIVRRRGPLLLIGVSTAVPTAPFMATGRLGEEQLDDLAPARAARIR